MDLAMQFFDEDVGLEYMIGQIKKMADDNGGLTADQSAQFGLGISIVLSRRVRKLEKRQRWLFAGMMLSTLFLAFLIVSHDMASAESVAEAIKSIFSFVY